MKEYHLGKARVFLEKLVRNFFSSGLRFGYHRIVKGKVKEALFNVAYNSRDRTSG